MSAAPHVSVLMPMWNAQPYLREAVESVLSQTLTDFEFVVVDDGSDDGGADWIEARRDPRIRLFRRPHRGVTDSLNFGLRQCRAPLIARMDADDVALAHRLERQAAFLARHADVGLVCSNARLIDTRGAPLGTHRMGRLDRPRLTAALAYRRAYTPLIHPSVMMRRAVAETLRGYRDFRYAEDFDFWIRAHAAFRFAAIPEPLLAYRLHAQSVSRARRLAQATSGLMCVVNHAVCAREGLDLFERRRDLYDRFAACAEARLRPLVEGAEQDIRAVRDLVRRRGWAQGAPALLAALGRHGPQILPSWRRRRLRLLAAELTGEIRAALAAERAPGATLAAALD